MTRLGRVGGCEEGYDVAGDGVGKEVGEEEEESVRGGVEDAMLLPSAPSDASSSVSSMSSVGRS